MKKVHDKLLITTTNKNMNIDFDYVHTNTLIKRMYVSN